MAVRNNTSTRVVVEGTMSTYDALPKHIRQKLANANVNWSPEETRDILHWEGSAWLTAFLRDAEQEMSDRHYAILASGQPYPREQSK